MIIEKIKNKMPILFAGCDIKLSTLDKQVFFCGAIVRKSIKTDVTDLQLLIVISLKVFVMGIQRSWWPQMLLQGD